MSVLSLPPQEPAGLYPWLGGRLGAKGVQRDFSPAPLQRTILSRAFRRVMYICRSQELKSLCESLQPCYLSWKTVTNSLQQGCVPHKDTVSLLLGCGGQKHQGFGRELSTFALIDTTSLTNYGANSKSTAEGLLYVAKQLCPGQLQPAGCLWSQP